MRDHSSPCWNSFDPICSVVAAVGSQISTGVRQGTKARSAADDGADFACLIKTISY
jgi:hypothetical protein